MIPNTIGWTSEITFLSGDLCKNNTYWKIDVRREWSVTVEVRVRREF